MKKPPNLTPSRTAPIPIAYHDTYSGKTPVYAHMVEVSRDRNGTGKVKCRGCDFIGRYPTRDHARAVADQHIVSTHATGHRVCGRPYCPADAALKRIAATFPNVHCRLVTDEP